MMSLGSSLDDRVLDSVEEWMRETRYTEPGKWDAGETELLA